MRRLLAAATVGLLLVGLALPAVAADLAITFDSERREWHGAVPALVEVGRADLGFDDARQCVVSFKSINNTSMHNTDLLVTTGFDDFAFIDIEQGESVSTSAEGQFGGVVVVYLQLNEHNQRGFAVSSLGGTVTIDCKETPSTSTTTTAVESTTTSSTTPIPTATTTQPNPTSTSSTTTSTSSSTPPPAPTTTAPTVLPTAPPELPATGPDTGVLALSAVALLVFGGLAVAAGKEGS